MKKKKNYIFYFFFLFLVLSPINVEAFGGSYRYDINKVTIGEHNLVIYGWAVTNDKFGNSIHNVNPEYTMKLIGKSNQNQKITESGTYKNEGARFRPDYGGSSDYPRDYTKAFYTIPNSGVYANKMYPTSGGGERANMVSKTNNRFYINTDFWFAIPIKDIKNLLKVKNVERIYFQLTMEVGTGNLTIFGQKFSVNNSIKREMNLAIQNNRVKEISKHKEFENLEFMDRAEKITVAASKALVQAQKNAFIGPNSDRRVKFWSENSNWYFSRRESSLIDLGKVRGVDYTMLYYRQHGSYRITDDNLFMEDIFGGTGHINTDIYGYYYYQVNTAMSQSSEIVTDGGDMITYIPALWGFPEEGKATYIKEETPSCNDREDCSLSEIDKSNNTCPPKTKSPNCCSLCDRTTSPNFAMYRITDFCTSINKCGTCETDKRCNITNGEVGSACPSAKTNCCSLCTNSTTKDKYKDTSFCTSVDKCGTCKTDTRCQITDTGVVPSTCPTEKNKCCNLCTDSATKAKYANTYFCKTKCKNIPTCSNNPECQTSKLGSNSKCPIYNSNNPMSGDCCKTICLKGGNTGTEYCTRVDKCGTCMTDKRCEIKNGEVGSSCPTQEDNCCSLCKTSNPKYSQYKNTDFCTKICKTTPPPDDGGSTQNCETTTDPQEKYCCEYPSMPFCNTYKETDPDYDPTNATLSKEKKGICDKDDEEKIKFKYPAKGYGQKVLENEACSISCQEIQDITFQKMPTLRAGMGFEYPIKIEGTRYCTAQYHNESWVSEVKTASTNANAYYDQFKVKYREAEELDEKCGISDYDPQSPKNNCNDGYSLNMLGRVCEKTLPLINECLEGSYNPELDTCVITHDPIRLNVPPYKDPKTGESKCLFILEGDDCVTYNSVPDTTALPKRCETGGDVVNGQCLYTKAACEPRYQLIGDTCKINVCSLSGQYYPDARDEILLQTESAAAKISLYQDYFNRYSKLLTDRKICDGFATAEKYDGPTKIKVSYEEDPKVQVSEQEKYAFSEDQISSSQKIGSNTKTTYQIYDIEPSGFDMSYSINAAPFVQARITNNFSHSIFYQTSAEYVDFWNDKADKETNLEFSKMYYVQGYTGELEETQFPGYEIGGKFVYTDFYRKSGKYKYDLNAINVGPNLPNMNPNLLIIKPFTCSYNLSNLIFPPKGGVNYNKYGNTGFEFRQISLTDPFPNRQARENWQGNESKIMGYTIYEQSPSYGFILSAETRRQIRNYNLGADYDSFDPEKPYTSKFLTKYRTILQMK